MQTREPGWYPDPEQPATLQRRWDGGSWTGDTRPTGYVTQPAGPEPVAAPGPGRPVFGATPPDTGGPGSARRRWRTAKAAAGVTALVALVAVVVALVVTG